MKVRTLFSGIGAPESALKRLEINYELVDFCEIDKYAVQSYCAVHSEPQSKNLGDISKVWGRDLPYADLLVWGFPCTDISVAGKQKGIVEGGTRSGLYYEGLRILKETKPKYSIIENVKNLTGKKFRAEFEQMLSDIEELGYNNYWQVLNSKNYGIPQNRERVFIVSIRKDIDTGYEFPKGFDNGLRLKDMLEDEVDEKYYISQEKTERLLSQLRNNNFDFIKGNTITVKNQATETATETALCLLARDYKGFGNQEMNAVCVPCLTPDRVEKRQNDRRFKEDGEPMFTLTSQDRHGILQVGTLEIKGMDCVKRVYSSEGISPTLTTMEGGNRQPKVLQRSRGYNKGGMHEICTPITSSSWQDNNHLVDNYRIRKLTPKECWRLMGFTDQEFQRAVDAGVSNSQLYKQAGNSIVVDVLCEIFKKLFIQGEINANRID